MSRIFLLAGSLTTFLEGDGLKNRAARGGLWIGGGSVVEQGLRLLRNIILARLLAPEAFGLMAIIFAVNTFFESCTSIGIEEAIIQNPRSEEQTYLNGAFWVSIGRAICLYVIIYFTAPWIAKFYNQPMLPNLMRVAFLVVLFTGAMSPRTYVAHKRMDFKRLVAINQGGGAFGVLVTIILSVFMRNVWAIAIGFAVESFARCALSYAICPYRPRLSFDRELLQALFKYSRGVFGLSFLTFIFLRTDVFVIGKICSTAELGIYSMVASLAQIPYVFFGTFISKIAVPAFSEMQQDKERLNNTFLKITSSVALLTFPALLYAILYAKGILHMFYGEVYVTAAIPFAILFAVAVIRVVSVPVVSLFFMIGRPELNRRYLFMRTAIMIILIYPAVKWYGLNGAAITGVIALVFSFVLQMFRLRSMIGFEFTWYRADLVRALWSLIPLIVTFMVTVNISSIPRSIYLSVGLMACILAYFISFRALFSNLIQNIRSHQTGVS